MAAGDKKGQRLTSSPLTRVRAIAEAWIVPSVILPTAQAFVSGALAVAFVKLERLAAAAVHIYEVQHLPPRPRPSRTWGGLQVETGLVHMIL